MTRRKIDLERRAEIGRERRARTRAKIVDAAFRIFGEENGLLARIEDIADSAEVTRATFYNHFGGMAELREAVTYELTHDFLNSVTATVNQIPDARQRSAAAIRFYLHRANSDRRWAWSMLNISANGIIYGAETYRQAEQTIREGMADGVFPLRSSLIGRDMVLGGCLAAISTMLREDTPDDYPEQVAGHILMGLGVPLDAAREMATRPLPSLVETSKLDVL